MLSKVLGVIKVPQSPEPAEKSSTKDLLMKGTIYNNIAQLAKDHN